MSNQNEKDENSADNDGRTTKVSSEEKRKQGVLTKNNLKWAFNHLGGKSLVAGFVGIAIATLSFFLEPVRNFAFKLVYPEKVFIKVNGPERLDLGQEFSVSATIGTRSLVPVSEGYLKFLIPEGLELSSRNSELDIDHEISGIERFPEDEETVTLIASKTGSYKIVCSFMSAVSIQKGIKPYTDTLFVEVSEIYKPSKINFSGNWFMKIGNSLGEMSIVESKVGGTVKLSGFYSFNDNEMQGAIVGSRDGSRFIVDFLLEPSNKPFWHIDASFDLKKSDKFIEISGQSLSNIDDEEYDFYASCKL